jgi:hypothetical protein
MVCEHIACVHAQNMRMTRVRRVLFFKPMTRVQRFSQSVANLHFY